MADRRPLRSRGNGCEIDRGGTSGKRGSGEQDFPPACIGTASRRSGLSLGSRPCEAERTMRPYPVDRGKGIG
jgi:hypothetical protein